MIHCRAMAHPMEATIREAYAAFGRAILKALRGSFWARHRFTRDGSQKDYRTAHVYEISDGKLVRCFEQPRDPAAFEDAWGPRQS
jgi:ketosteroid isomerase-like protein